MERAVVLGVRQFKKHLDKVTKKKNAEGFVKDAIWRRKKKRERDGNNKRESKRGIQETRRGRTKSAVQLLKYGGHSAHTRGVREREGGTK